MKLEVPFLQLPVSFDAERLAEEVAAVGETAWRPHPQGYPGNDALTLVSVDGDPGSDAVRGPMRPTPHLLRCPYLMQVMEAIGGVWGRSRLMRLSGQAEVTRHVDVNYYWREHMRVHVPIVTQPTVRFECGGAEINMAAGECWIFDTWRLHRVTNDAERARIHLVADTVGGPGLWSLLGRSRPHDRQIAGWSPARIDFAADKAANLDLESVNLPKVMSPWEAREHLGFLISEVVPDERLPKFVQAVGRFMRAWMPLWAQYGEDSAGFPAYRRARDEFLTQIDPLASIKLKNTMSLVNCARTMVLSNLIAESGTDSGAELRSTAA